MPKERSHWLFAVRSVERLPQGRLRTACERHPELVLAGAVSHDTGYYALTDRAARKAADYVHGTGDDSWQPFRRLLARRAEFGDSGLAFGWGALSHLGADTVFHPLVFSWTGDEGAPGAAGGSWLSRHQACETSLDIELEFRWGRAPATTYRQIIRQTEDHLEPLVSTFLDAPARNWIQAHARLQRLFSWSVLKPLAGRWSGAFYPLARNRQPAWQGVLTWLDPVSGDSQHASLDDLVGSFDRTMAALAPSWESSWISGNPFGEGVGPALDTGYPGNFPQEKGYFQLHPAFCPSLQVPSGEG